MEYRLYIEPTLKRKLNNFIKAIRNKYTFKKNNTKIQDLPNDRDRNKADFRPGAEVNDDQKVTNHYKNQVQHVVHVSEEVATKAGDPKEQSADEDKGTNNVYQLQSNTISVGLTKIAHK